MQIVKKSCHEISDISSKTQIERFSVSYHKIVIWKWLNYILTAAFILIHQMDTEFFSVKSNSNEIEQGQNMPILLSQLKQLDEHSTVYPLL